MGQQQIILPVERSLPGFNGVGTGQTASLALPIGPAYRRLWLNYSGVSLAQMTEIRLTANGEVIRRYAAADLDTINQFDERQAASGQLFLDFERRLLLQRAAREITALGTGVPGALKATDIRNLVLEVDIAAGIAGTITLSGKADLANPQASGLILKTRTYPYSPTAAGGYEIADLPKKGIWSRVYFFSTNVNSVKLELDQTVVHDRTAAENNRIQTDSRIRVPQAGLYVWDATEEGYGGNGLDPIAHSDIRWTLNMAAAGTVKVVVESLEDPTPYQA